MFFSRTLLVVLTAFALSAPVFADDTTSTQPPVDASSSAQQTMGSDQQSDSAMQEKVDINKATMKELKKVKGLSHAKAKAIVSYRKKHGDFKSLDDLSNVKGFKKMKPETMKSIQDQLTL